jgi:hypothetical protein
MFWLSVFPLGRHLMQLPDPTHMSLREWGRGAEADGGQGGKQRPVRRLG